MMSQSKTICPHCKRRPKDWHKEGCPRSRRSIAALPSHLASEYVTRDRYGFKYVATEHGLKRGKFKR